MIEKDKLYSIWVYLQAEPLFWLTLTIGSYLSSGRQHCVGPAGCHALYLLRHVYTCTSTVRAEKVRDGFVLLKVSSNSASLLPYK